MLPNAVPKPVKGSALIARREKRKAIEAHEEAEKHKVRIRDRMQCRWPGCEYCRRYKNLTLHVAHLKSKGRGGDHGRRSTANQMILICSMRHEGPISVHSGDCRISPLTSRGTDGPCIFEMQDEQKGWQVVGCEDDRR
jgi:hypothetical protein